MKKILAAIAACILTISFVSGIFAAPNPCDGLKKRDCNRNPKCQWLNKGQKIKNPDTKTIETVKESHCRAK